MALVVSVAVVFLLVAWVAYDALSRPLFHERYDGEHSYEIPFFPTWTQTYRVVDRAGVIGFLDAGENLLVVIVTDDKNIRTKWTEIDASPYEAVLLVGTPYEARVRARRNTLMIIENGTRLCFPIEQGQAQQWCNDILALTSNRGWTVLGEIARSYHGGGKEAIEEIAGRAAERLSE